VVTQLTPGRAAELCDALAAVCAPARLDPAGAQLLKYTVNAVYRLPHAGVVVRVADDPGAADRARRVVSAARWLAGHRAPVIRLVEGIAQPVTVGLAAATFWVELGDHGVHRAVDLAGPLRALHALPPGGPLPRWSPFEAAARRLACADDLADDDRDWLAGRWAAAGRDWRAVAGGLRTGVVHGDAHPGNLLRDGRGRYVLCDLDSAGLGPLDWDLVPAAVAAIRFGTPRRYAELAARYGRDVTAGAAWPVLRRIRELVMVTAVAGDLRQRPAVAAEHARRLRHLREGEDTARWVRY
jgi:aminoglycoside phosphotransferase (APT) family kinase protein